MPKLRLLVLHFTPLCLKLRGRIIGAISRETMTIYIAFGLLVVSSLLLFIIVFGMKNYPNTGVIPEKKSENQVVESVEDKPALTAVSPQDVAEPVSQAIENQPVQEARPKATTIKGPITVEFGWQLHKVYKDWRYHTGIDISGPVGQSVEAIDNGQVTDIFRDHHSGLTVIVKNSTYSVYYGSLSAVKVDKGSSIRSGQTVGTMGSCDAEPYNHLHLGIKKDDQYIDPKLVISQE